MLDSDTRPPVKPEKQQMKKEKKNNEMIVYGTVKVSDKGQIALPVELRNDINIKRGDLLLVVRKENSSSFSLISMDEIKSTVSDRYGDLL